MNSSPQAWQPQRVGALVAAFSLLQVAFAFAVIAIVVNFQEASRLANVIGFQRTAVSSLDFHIPSKFVDSPQESQRVAERIDRFRAVQEALRNGGTVELPYGDTITVDALRCPDCQSRLTQIDQEFSAFAEIGLGLAGQREAAQTLLDELQARESKLINLIIGLINAIEAQNVNRLTIAIVVVTVTGAIDIAVFFWSLSWLRRQHLESSRTTQQLALLATQTRNTVIYTDANRRITWVNDAFTRSTGYSLEEVLGKTPAELLQGPATDRATTAMISDALARVGHVEQVQILNYRKDGTPIWLSLDIEAIRDASGKIESFISVQSDITQQVLQQRELLERDQLQSAVMESAHNAILVINEDGIVELFNPAAERIFGYTAEQMLGKSLDRLLPISAKGAVHAAHVRDFGSATRTSRTMGDRTVHGIRADGSEVPLLASIARLSIGGHTRFVAILMDVSIQQQAAAAKQQSEVALLANQAKTRFLATMSHELRTPLNAVVGFAQLAAKAVDETRDPRLAHYVHGIGRASTHLVELIDDVLDLASAESGVMSLQMELVDLATVAKDCVMLISPQADEAGVTLHWIEGVPAPVIRGDHKRVQQVVTNLLSNAIKYNYRGGSVLVRVDHGESETVLQVADSGEGMSQDQISHMFEPFNRLGAERTSKPGTGIGLALVKQLVESMGGKVLVTSTPGKGTIFSVAFPAAEMPSILSTPSSATPPVQPTYPSAAPRGRILYVEDSLANVELVREIIRMLPDVTMTAAPDGESALRQADSATYDLVLVDMNLPDMKGTQVLRALRERERYAKTPIFALTADLYAQYADGEAEAFDQFLTKPIDIDAFVATVSAALTIGVKPS